MLVRTSLILIYRKSFRQSLWHSEADNDAASSGAPKPPPRRNPNYYPFYVECDRWVSVDFAGGGKSKEVKSGGGEGGGEELQEGEKEVEKKEVKVEKSGGGGGEELQEVEKKWAGGLKRKTLPKAQAAESEEGAFGAEEAAVGAEAEEAVGAEAAEAVGAEAAADERFAMDAAEAKRRRKETMEMEELEHQVQTERAQWKEVLALLQRSHHDKQLKHQQQLIAQCSLQDLQCMGSASATAATSSTDAAAAAEATEATEAVEDNVDDGASGQSESDDGASGETEIYGDDGCQPPYLAN